jgi:hypothetical protein
MRADVIAAERLSAVGTCEREEIDEWANRAPGSDGKDVPRRHGYQYGARVGTSTRGCASRSG